MSRPSVIAFYRPPGVWRDRLRAYRLVVNGVQVGAIRRGQVVRVAVQPGRHHVRAEIDWTGSPWAAVDVPAGSEVRVQVEPAGNALMIWQMFGADSWLRLVSGGTVPLP